MAMATLAGGMATGRLGPAAESHRASSGTSTELASADTGSWPSGLQEAAAATIEAEAYAIEASGSGEWRADNPAQDLEATFFSEGLRVVHAAEHDSDWTFSLSLSGIGRDDVLSPVAPAEMVTRNSGMEYRRGDITEWYRNDERGIEQGFTLAAPPADAGGGGAVVVELALAGDLEPRLADGGRGLILADASGVDVARYDGLIAFDATGRDLAAHMELAEGALRLVVDDAEASYPLTIDPVINTQEARLSAFDADVGDGFGWSVAVSGDTAVVGAPGDDDAGAQSGSAYVFVRSGTAWTLQSKLTAGDAAVGDEFGRSAAVSGDTVVVGAPFNDDAGSNSGSAYVYTRSGTAWAPEAKLTASNPSAGDEFGRSVAISADTAVVGAPHYGAINFAPGSAYVFTRSGTAWSQQADLPATGRDYFGISVAVSGDTAVVGEIGDSDAGPVSGSAHVFTRSGTTWSQQDKLIAGDAGDFDEFGWSVAVSGDTAVVGAPGDAKAGYVFTRSGTDWNQEDKLIPASDDSGFGWSVAVSGDTAVVGASRFTGGSAHVYTRSGTDWSQAAQVSGDGAVGDNFAFSVAVSGDTAVVGAPRFVQFAPGPGSAYVFVPSTATGGISGTVTDGAVGIGGALVEVCLQGASFCVFTSTAPDGTYQATNLPPGSYNVSVSPPGNFFPKTATASLGVGAQLIVDFVLDVPQPPPAGTSINSNPPLPPTSEGIPRVLGGSLTLQTMGCPGGTANFVITSQFGQPFTGPLTEGPPGTYSAINFIVPFVGPAVVHITIDCPSDLEDQEVEFSIYIDPSGFVRNSQGDPIPGATVTLYRSDTEVGPFTVVPDGSVIMSPSNRTNPDVTDDTGHFGWDVVAGFYFVRAEAEGCASPDDPSQSFVDTEVLTIPPPVTDLDIRLACASEPPPDDGSLELDGTARTDGTRTRVTGSLTCEQGDRYLVTVVLTQGPGTGEGRATGACTGSSQTIQMVVVTLSSGPPFSPGLAEACGVAQIGTPGSRTINRTDDDCTDVSLS